jgi:zinc transporter ZupT
VADIEDINMKPTNSECPLADNDGNCSCVQSSTESETSTVDIKPSTDKVSLSVAHHDDHDGHDEHSDLEAGHHNMRSLILIMALSLHHLFEGMSLGLQHTVTSVFTLLLALMCHETIISFSLGLQFVKCKYSLKRFIITAISVSTIMPIGVAIGKSSLFVAAVFIHFNVVRCSLLHELR